VDCAGVVLFHNSDNMVWRYATIAGGEPIDRGGGGAKAWDFD
jgi:hypothetical protein